MANRRDFLKKLGIGTFVMGSAGIFTLEKPALIIADNEHVKKTLYPPEIPLDLRYTNKEEFIKLCSDIFNAMDGKNTNSMIYEATREILTKGTVYEKGLPEVDCS